MSSGYAGPARAGAGPAPYDPADAAQVIATILEGKGWQVTEVGNVATFDVWIGTQWFRVAVTDRPAQT